MMRIDEVQKHFRGVKTTLDLLDNHNIQQAVYAIFYLLNEEGTVFLCGNGGSHSNASHGAVDFSKYITLNGRKLKTHCLGLSVSMLTATANDSFYEQVFVEEMIDNFQKEDILIAISGSGESSNVIKAAKYAQAQGGIVIGMTGFDGGELQKLCNISLHVPIDDMQVTEDIHMILLHAITLALKEIK